jgi:shikimate kinase
MMAMEGKVYLIGFSGSGKSHLAPLLAHRLRIPHHDTDAMIEQHSGVSISQLFATQGEKHFRNLEAAQIERLANDPNPAVVALGGGALMDPTVRRLVQASGIVIYLSCSVEGLYRRLREKHDRPLLATKPKLGETPVQATKRHIRELLNKRRAVYRQADITVSTSRRTPTETVDRICERIKQHYA